VLFHTLDRQHGILSMPVESHSGARETIIAGPYHNLIQYAPRSRHRRRREGERGEGCLLMVRLGVWGSVISSPSGVMPILGQKEAIWNNLFSIFDQWQGPLNVAGPGKTPPASRRA